MDSDEEIDYYEVLGIKKSATSRQIRNAYKDLSIKYHPDKNQDNIDQAGDKFKIVNEAYTVLSDIDKRELYDKFGRRAILEEELLNGSTMTSEEARENFKTYFKNSPNMNHAGAFANNIPLVKSILEPLLSGMGLDINNANITTKTKPLKPMIDNPGIIKNDTSVILKGLKNNTRLNGKYGVIVGYKESKDRYKVKVNEKIKYLKRENFFQRIMARVKLYENTDYDYRRCRIVDYDEKTKLYTVKLGRRPLETKVEKLLFQPETVVQLVNIRKKPYLNGQYATIRDYFKDDERYQIVLKNGKRICLTTNNFIVN